MLLLKKLAARLPDSWQTILKRLYFRRQIANGTFVTDEPEYKILPDLIKAGDWVVDIGANVGHYTKRFSELVGAKGRVIAFEPVPTTFFILSGNIQLFQHPNVSLINSAVSDKLELVGISTPQFESGLTNYYQAHISSAGDSTLPVLAISLDSILSNHNVALVKIDAEGHEAFVLAGMRAVVKASHPILIVETGSTELIAEIEDLGYFSEKLKDSPNVLFKPKSRS